METSLISSLVALFLFQIHSIDAIETNPARILDSLHSLSSKLTPCIDKNEYRYENKDKQSCKWIRNDESRRQDLCLDIEIVLNCPASCGYCCENDSDYVFLNNMDEDQQCEWISTPTMQMEYCSSWQNGQMIRDACPKACDFCQAKVDGPTIDTSSASVLYTAPTIDTKVLTNDPILCINNEKFRYEDISAQSCGWIERVESRRQTFCRYENVISNCPISCGHCCEDDTSYYFQEEYNSNEEKACDWLAHNTMRQNKYCALWRNGRMVRDACAHSCDSCKNKVTEKDRDFMVSFYYGT